MIKIQGGTPTDVESLCTTCSEAWIRTDARGTHTRCNLDGKAIPTYGRVTSCNCYTDKRSPSKYDMEKIAWEIKTDRSGKVLGFTPPTKEKD